MAAGQVANHGNLATLFEMLVTLFEKLDNNQEC